MKITFDKVYLQLQTLKNDRNQKRKSVGFPTLHVDALDTLAVQMPSKRQTMKLFSEFGSVWLFLLLNAQRDKSMNQNVMMFGTPAKRIQRESAACYLTVALRTLKHS